MEIKMMWRNHTALLTFALIYLTATSNWANGTRQQLIFFANDNCTGRNETVNVTVPYLNGTFMGSASSVRIIGLWTISIHKDVSGGSTGTSVTRGDAQPPDGVCANKGDLIGNPPDKQVYYFHRVEYFGPQDMTTSQITFFTDPSFRGMRYHVRNANAKLAQRPFAMQTVAQFSSETWVVYPEHEFGGKPTCLKPMSTGDKEASHDSFSYNDSTVLIVGSVKIRSGEECSSAGKLHLGLGTYLICFILIVPSFVIGKS